MVALESNNYRFSTLLIEIVKCDPFQMRTTASVGRHATKIDRRIRVFLQDGVNDNRSPNDLDRDWHLQNQAMVAALNEEKYDMAHVFGVGAHSDDHGGAILPEMLQWIWRDYPSVNSAGAEKLVELARQRKPERINPFPNFDEKSMISPIGT